MQQKFKPTQFYRKHATGFEWCFFVFWLELICCFFSQFVFASEHFVSLQEHELRHLAQSTQWTRALYFGQNLFSNKSIVNETAFFLSENGASDPYAELAAFYKKYVKNEEKVLCQFPLRTKILITYLINKGFPISSPECVELNTFKSTVNSNKLVLVFSSYYPNNPSSLFGHTFLRFSRKVDKKNLVSPLLDMSLGYSAQPNTANPLLYTLYGLTGQFPGYFDIQPYYIKVQEYSNAESRDLWEYQLNITEDGIDNILNSLWELKDQNIPYYYFNRNCSFMVLKLIEQADPAINLTNAFGFYVVPSDTLGVLYKTNLIESVVYRPSIYKKFHSSYNLLSPKQARLFLGLLGKSLTWDALPAIDPHGQARVLDSLLDFFDYDEQLAGSKEPVKWKDLRKEALLKRARLHFVAAPEPPLGAPSPPNMATTLGPHRAHPSSRLLVAYFKNGWQQEGVSLNWRPALHDLASDSLGFSPHLEIGFFETDLAVSLKSNPPSATPLLKSFSLIHIFAANPYSAVRFKPAWSLDIGWSRANRLRMGRGGLKVGVGTSWDGGWLNSYVLGQGEAFSSQWAGKTCVGGGGLLAGVVGVFPYRIQGRLEAISLWYKGKGPLWAEHTQMAVLTKTLDTNTEIRFKFLRFGQKVWEAQLGWGLFF